MIDSIVIYPDSVIITSKKIYHKGGGATPEQYASNLSATIKHLSDLGCDTVSINHRDDNGAVVVGRAKSSTFHNNYFNESKATAIRRVADQVSKGLLPRPLRTDAETPTDFVNDFEWAAMIVEGTYV